MNAHEYFHYKLRNVTNDIVNMTIITDPTELQRSYEGWLTITGGISCLFGSLFNFLTTERLDHNFRIISGHIIVFLSLIPTILFTFVCTDYVQELFFWLSMLLAAVACFGSAGLLGCGLLGYSARFPAVYMQAVMLGQSFAGILSSLLSIFCQAFTSNSLLNGRLYFAIATIWTFASGVLYIWLIKSPHTIAVMNSEVNETSRMEQNRNLLLDTDDVIDGLQSEVSDNSLRSRIFEDDSLKKHIGRILSQTKYEMSAGYCVLFATLTVFPALSSLVESTATNELWKAYFSAIACFLLFNVGDAIGRLLFYTVPLEGRLLLILSWLRLAFIPLLVLCNVHPRSHTSTLFYSDSVFILLMGIFAVSNGLLFTAASISATRKVEDDLREMTGSLVGLVAVVSSLMGSIFGAALVALV